MDINVTAAPGSHLGQLRMGKLTLTCALGRTGLSRDKHEGDGGTPIGEFRLLELLYRPDRLERPATSLPVKKISPQDGWCDAPQDVAYNRPVPLPYPASAERMWRDDHLYDLVAILDYNMTPVKPFAGSAIFFHLAKEEQGVLAATEGCVALLRADMLEVLRDVTPQTIMRIG